MDQAGIQQKVARGFATAARFLGSTYVQIRPTTPDAPLTQPSLQTLLANFDRAATFAFQAPSDWGKPARYGLLDTSDVEVGDYFVAQPEPGAVLFVAAFEPFQPPLCILCNRVLTISRPGADVTAGYTPTFGGRTTGTDTVLAIGWPASLLIKNKGEGDPARLPGDVKAASFEVLLPLVPGVTLKPTDRLTDETGTVYVIAAVEISSYGNRLLAGVSTT